MNPEIINIWKQLYLKKVRYLTIGGFAVNFYGYNRSTGDIDLLIEDTLENRKKLREAFKEIGIGDFKEIEHINFLPGWTDFTLNYGMRLDVMTSVKGLEDKSFEDLFSISNELQIEDIPVKFIDYGNLIISKKAANRLKDQLDIEELEKINKWNEENKS